MRMFEKVEKTSFAQATASDCLDPGLLTTFYSVSLPTVFDDLSAFLFVCLSVGLSTYLTCLFPRLTV